MLSFGVVPSASSIVCFNMCTFLKSWCFKDSKLALLCKRSHYESDIIIFLTIAIQLFLDIFVYVFNSLCIRMFEIESYSVTDERY